MSMSKKDYEAIARNIQRVTWKWDIDAEVALLYAECIADYCTIQSASFDRARFLKACGVET